MQTKLSKEHQGSKPLMQLPNSLPSCSAPQMVGNHHDVNSINSKPRISFCRAMLPGYPQLLIAAQPLSI
jgi:hypothetical protein